MVSSEPGYKGKPPCVWSTTNFYRGRSYKLRTVSKFTHFVHIIFANLDD